MWKEVLETFRVVMKARKNLPGSRIEDLFGSCTADVAATSESPYDGHYNSISAALHRLEGQKVENVEIDADATTVFTFDLGGKLICKRFSEWEPDEELWSLRTTNGLYGLLANGKWRENG